MTAFATHWIARDAGERDRERFKRMVAGEWNALESRIEANERVLARLASYFDERGSVNTNQWRHQLELINPEVNHSELVEIGFALSGHRLWQAIPAHEAMGGGLASAAADSKATNLVYFPVLYSWRPERWPRRGYGESYFSDQALKDVFNHTYMSTQAAMSRPYPLWEEASAAPGSTRGVTLTMATFAARMVTNLAVGPKTDWSDDKGEPASLRRNNLVNGAVFFSWRMDDLFRSVFGDDPREVVLEIFDGTEPIESRRWNRFPPAWLTRGENQARSNSGLPWKPALTLSLIRPNYGGKVLIRSYTTPWFDRQSHQGRASMAAAFGGLLSVALAGLILVQVRGRDRAEALAVELSDSRELLRRAALDRERLSRDLHDGTVQSLYAVGLGLGALRRSMDDSRQRERERIDHALIELDEVVAELRRYLVQLDPGVSPVQRPEVAVGQMVERLRRVAGIEMTLTVGPGFEVTLPAEIVLDLLQVVRETVSNAVRHGFADRVDLRLEQRERAVRLEVRDDGKGFDPAARTGFNEGGFGLENLRRRAESHGGSLEVFSQPGGPTLVTFEVPAHE